MLFISFPLIFRNSGYSFIDSCGWRKLHIYSFLAAGGELEPCMSPQATSSSEPSLRSSLGTTNFPFIKLEWTPLFSSLFCKPLASLWKLHYISRLRLLCHPCPRHRPLESQSKNPKASLNPIIVIQVVLGNKWWTNSSNSRPLMLLRLDQCHKQATKNDSQWNRNSCHFLSVMLLKLPRTKEGDNYTRVYFEKR